MPFSAPLVRIPWPAWAALLSAAMLATAHGFQHLGGYEPCPLCLRQREVYWGALAVAGAGLILVRLRKAPLWTVSLLLGGVFVGGAIVAAFHAGVEWKWWPGPSTCSGLAAGAVEISDLVAILDGAKVRAPACDEAAWRLAGLSMAGWNALVSAALAAVSFVVAAKERA